MSKIGILGTGAVGTTVGSKLIELGHSVMIGSRTSDNEVALAFVAKGNGKATKGTYMETAAFAEVIFNCTKGNYSVDALKLAGESNLRNKIIVDIANPLDFSNAQSPSFTILNTNSLGEEIQKQFPDSKVVKALNTIWCEVMVNPAMLNGGDHTTFVSGNDSEAKEIVKEILKSFGWFEKNIFDLGDITTARGTEMYLALWFRIMKATNSGAFNIKIVS